MRVVNVGLPRTPRNFGVTESWKKTSRSYTTDYVSAAEPGAGAPEPSSEILLPWSPESVTQVFHGVPPYYSGPDTPRFNQDPPAECDPDNAAAASSGEASASGVVESVRQISVQEFERVEDPLQDLL